MDVMTLKVKIQNNQFPDYLIFTGDEWKVQQIYIDQIAKVTGKEVRRVDSISSVYKQLRNVSFIRQAVIYIVRDDVDLLSNEKLQHQIAQGVLGNNILIHLLTNVDKRTKFYKQYKDAIIEFERLSDATLKKYIQKEIKLSERNIERLIDICEHDYGRILLEIDKIKRYYLHHQVKTDRYGVNYDVSFQELLKDGTIYEPPYDAIVDLADAILDRKVDKSFNLLEQSYAVGEATMVMLSVLYNKVKAVLQVQTYSGNNILKSTGLSEWQINSAKQHMGKYSEDDLIYIVRLIQQIESGIKTGIMEDQFAMPYLLVKMFSR